MQEPEPPQPGPAREDPEAVDLDPDMEATETPQEPEAPPASAGAQLCGRIRRRLENSPAGSVEDVPAAQVRKAFGLNAAQAIAAQAAASGLSVWAGASPDWVFRFRLIGGQGEAQTNQRERQDPRPSAARPTAPEAPTPAQWQELRARRGDTLAAARALLKDAGSVTRWSRVLIEQAEEMLQEGHERRRGQPSGDAPEVGDATDGNDHALVIRLEGDLDLLTSPPLLALLLGMDGAALGRRRAVLLDLRGVAFLDMSGCRAMIDGAKTLRQRGMNLAVWLRPDSQPERVYLRQSLGTVLRRVEGLDDL